MRTFFARIGAIVAVVCLLASLAVAAPDKKPKKAAAPKCKACGMTLSAKKTKATPVAVKIKGKTWYCCSDCKMAENQKPKTKAKKSKS